MKHIYPKTSIRTSSTSVFHPWQHCLLLLLMFLTFSVGNAWGANVTWDQVAWGDITTSDVIIVTVTTSNGTYLLEHSQGTSATPKLGNTGTLTNSNTNCTFSENDNVKWKKDANNRLCKASDGTKWLYTGTSNNAMRVGTSTSGNIWSLDGNYIKSNASNRYLSVYSTTDFRSYTSKQSNQVTRFYKASSTPSYTITAQSNNNSYGTVSLSGNVITGSPNSGYTYGSPAYSVSPANSATVSQDGDEFTVTPTANTTVTINFESIPTYAIRFFNNGTQIGETQNVIAGAAATKPSTNPTVCDGYNFVGWWTANLNADNTTAQTWVSDFTATKDQDYYAVYSHSEGGGSGSAEVASVTFANASSDGNADKSSAISDLVDSESGISSYSGTKVYAGTTGVKLGSSSAVGSITLTLSSAANVKAVKVTAKKYGSDTGTLSVKAGSTTIGSSQAPPAETGELTFTAGSAVADATTITIATSSKRAYISSITVISEGGGGTTTYTSAPECRNCTEPTIEFEVTTVDRFYGDAPFKIVPNTSDNTLDAPIHYTSSNTSIAEVSDDGTVTIKDAMSNEPVTITATLDAVEDGEDCQKAVSDSYTLNVYYKVTWLVNGSEYTAGDPTPKAAKGGQITAYPEDPDGSDFCGGKTFMGWTTAEYPENDTPPTPLFTDLSSMSGVYITQDTTFYAVYAEEDSNDSGSGDTFDGSTGGTFKIYAQVGENKYYATGTGTGSKISSTTDEEAATEYTFEKLSENGWAIRAGSTYITYSSNTNLGTSSSAYTWLIEQGARGTWRVISSVTNTRAWIFRAGNTNQFGGYATSNVTSTGEYYDLEIGGGSGGGGTTYTGYTTSCGRCLSKPEITSVIVKKDYATITWNAVNDATGYDFTCSDGTVTVTGTTATITGLTPTTKYNYSVRALGDESYTCFPAATGSFTTSDCDDVPYDITVTPYNVVQAIIRWKAEGKGGKVIVYKDEACSQTHATINADTTMCYVNDLKENTQYWFKIFAGGTCSSGVQTFTTQTTAVELVEWRDSSIVILLTGDAGTVSVLLEDKDDLDTENTTTYADSIFFSKYFEAAGNTKLLAIFNGTNHDVDISNYELAIAQSTSQGTPEFKKTRFDKMIYYKSNNSEVHFTADQMLLKAGAEMIFISYQSESDADQAIIECALNNENAHFETYYRLKSPELQFNGDDAVGLVNPQGNMIDLIGAGTLADGPDLTYIDATNQSGSQGGTYHGFMDKPGGWYNTKGYHAESDGTDTKDYALSTNRCLLIRRNHVKSGLTAVARNTEDFVTLGDYTYMGEDYEGEWKGVQIPGAGCNDGNCAGVKSACGQFDHVGSYDYQEYYATFDSVAEIKDLDRDDETGTITIKVPGLDTMSCSMLRVNVLDSNRVVKASQEYRIPIIIKKGSASTSDSMFIRHRTSVCKECDVLVYSGATLSKAKPIAGKENRDTIGHLTLYPGSTLNLPDDAGDLHVQSITYRVEGDIVPTTNLNSNLFTESQKLIVTRRIKNDRYYFISFPYNVAIRDITLASGETAVNGKDFRLMEYNSEERATKGSQKNTPGHWKSVSGDSLIAGRGYAIAVNTTAMKEIMFPMALPSKNLTNEECTKQTNTVAVNEYVDPNSVVRNTNYNWNLIAHPYITTFDMEHNPSLSIEDWWENPTRTDSTWFEEMWQDSTYTHYPDSSGIQTGSSPRRAKMADPGPSPGGIYITVPVARGGKIEYDQHWINELKNIPPFTAVFVQGDGSGNLTFNMYPDPGSGPAPARALRAPQSAEDNTIFVGVKISGNGESDFASVRLHPRFRDTYKFGLDLLKFTTFNTARPQLYMKTETDQLSFRATSDNVAKNTWMPMGVYCRDAGEYTFSLYDRYTWDEVEAVYLRDNLTGAETNLLMGNYTITTTGQIYTNTRFSLKVLLRRKVKDTPTMIDHTENPNAPRKFLRDGVLYILRDDKIYDATGKPVQNETMLNR